MTDELPVATYRRVAALSGHLHGEHVVLGEHERALALEVVVHTIERGPEGVKSDRQNDERTSFYQWGSPESEQED